MRNTFPAQALISFLLLILLLLHCDDVIGQHRRRYWRQPSRRQSPRTSRRQNSQYTRAPGANMCKVQQVLGTRKKFFTHCLSKYLKVVCERPTFERWECCAGFVQQRGERGCTGVKPLTHIMDLADDLGLHHFRKHVRLAGLDDELSEKGAYTVFAPSNTAIWETSSALQSRLSTSHGTSPPLLQYHIAPGRMNISLFKQRNQQFVTLYRGLPIRVNKYAYGVATVNCARIIRPDEKATNGIIHVIDKVLNPMDVHSTLAERVAEDSRFSQFNMALLLSDMAKKLRSKRGSFTVLAPVNSAFSKLPNDLLERILTDADTAEKVIQRHIIRGVFCADAIVLAVGLKTFDDQRLLFRCKRDGLKINEAKVLYPDMISRNGVLHGIDTVLLPDAVKSANDLMQDMRLGMFMEMVSKAGLNGTLDNENITVFSPTDQAIAALSRRYMETLRDKPEELQKLIAHHVIQGKVTDDQIVGDTSLDSVFNLQAKIRVTVYRNGVLLDKSSLDPNFRQCRNAVVRRVDRVLVPPETDLMGEMELDPTLSKFARMLRDSGVSDDLKPDGSYTVLAPTNAALGHLDQRQLQEIKRNIHRVKRFVRRHMIHRTVMKCALPESGTYNVPSIQGDVTKMVLNFRRKLVINKHSYAISDDMMTTNGMLYKIDHVIYCSCEPFLRNRRGRYLREQRYRRH